MELVVAIAIGILSTIFVGSVVALVFVCRQKCRKETDLISQQHSETSRPDVQLIEEDSQRPGSAGVELEDVQISDPKLDQILKDENWVDDVTGLVPHCLSVLKTCKYLTEQLVGMTMGNSQTIQTQELLTEVVTVAKRISPRVDEVVVAMYPPLDPRLLEARCTALVLSVNHLVLVTKHACHLSGEMDWIDQKMADVEEHLRVLREASLSLEMSKWMAESLPEEDETSTATAQQAQSESSQV